MNDAVLNLGFREHGFNGIGKTGEIVRTGDENVLYTAISQAVEHICPVLGALVFAYPHTQNVLLAVQIDTNGNVNCLFNDLSLAADVEVDGVQKYNRIDALDSFAEKWDGKYPKIAQSWRDNWPNLSTYFKYPEEVRRLIYTTNAIEGFNRQLRKVTKAKSVFPTDDSLFKMLYLAMMDITKKWTGRRQDWSRIHAQLTVYFDDRMPE